MGTTLKGSNRYLKKYQDCFVTGLRSIQFVINPHDEEKSRAPVRLDRFFSFPLKSNSDADSRHQ